MKRLDDLPGIASRQLAGLTATPQLRARIQMAASKPKTARRAWRPTAFACAATALVVALVLLPSGEPVSVAPAPTASVLDSQPAGGNAQTGLTVARNAGVTLGAGTENAAENSLFAPSDGDNFPLVRVDGATYRLLRSPESVDEALLGESLGAISEYTLQPALATADAASNAVRQGETVYAVGGMRGAMVIAPVNGTLRAFQRVSFGGAAVRSGETLADLLADADEVAELELTGHGRVTGEKARALMETLLSEAVYEGASVNFNTASVLLIRLQNGLTMQLMVDGEALSACGTWICPEFFEAYAQAAE